MAKLAGTATLEGVRAYRRTTEHDAGRNRRPCYDMGETWADVEAHTRWLRSEVRRLDAVESWMLAHGLTETDSLPAALAPAR